MSLCTLQVFSNTFNSILCSPPLLIIKPTGNHFSIKLPHLQEIQISGFLGLEYQISLMKLLYASSPALQKIQVKFDSETTECQNLLPQIPFAEVGQWESAPTDRTFVWTRIITYTDEFFCSEN